MKPLIKIIFSLLLIIAFSGCALKKNLTDTGTTILPLGDTVQIREGSLVYALPLTVLHFTVTVEHEYEKPGPYAKYAGEYLGLQNVISEENESWSIINIDVKTSEELDPSEFYVIESNTLMQTNAFSLKREGLILDLNPELYNKDISGNLVQNSFQGFQFTDMGSDEYFEVTRDTAYRVVEIDTAFIRIPYLVEKKKPLGIDQLAENAAKTLLDLRDGKQMILTGEANVFPQGDASIVEMNRLEKEYLALFTGKTYSEIKTYSYDLIPIKSMISAPVTLFKFSELTGVIDLSKPGGNPVNIEFVPALKTKELMVVKKPETSSDQSKVPARNFDKLYYRIPDIVNIRISSKNGVISNLRKLIYQFGEVITLPENYIIGK
jgi:hypothetical protein